MMKKHICLLTLSSLWMLTLPGATSPAFASTNQVSSSHSTALTALADVAQADRPAWYVHGEGHFNRRTWYVHQAWYRGWRVHRQISCGTGDSDTYQVFQGTNQDNTGNQGENIGFTQANATNNGNQMIHQGLNEGFEHTFQFSCGFNDSGNITYGIGSNIGNGGNQGYNAGYLQDNSGNNGNQIIG
jgi:hypothetical protein